MPFIIKGSSSSGGTTYAKATVQGVTVAGNELVSQLTDTLIGKAGVRDNQTRGTIVNGYASYVVAVARASSVSEFWVAYRDDANSYYGTIVHVLTDGETWTVGTPQVFTTSNAMYIDIELISMSNCVAISYRDVGNNYYLTYTSGSVYSSSSSFKTPIVVDSSAVLESKMCDNEEMFPDEIMIAWHRDDGTKAGRIAHISNAGVYDPATSVGTQQTFESGAITAFNIKLVENDKVAIAYIDESNSYRPTCCICTNSSGTITTGTPVVAETNNAYNTDLALIDTNKFAYIYRKITGQTFKVRAITVSGTVPTFYGEIDLVDDTDGTPTDAEVFKTDTNEVGVSFKQGGESRFIMASFSGTTPTKHYKTSLFNDVGFQYGTSCKMHGDKYIYLYQNLTDNVWSMNDANIVNRQYDNTKDVLAMSAETLDRTVVYTKI